MSRYGKMNFSLMSAQMILVISSPSSSTTGFLTLIFVRASDDALRVCWLCNEVGLEDDAMRALSAARRDVGWEDIVLAGKDVSGLVENALCRRGTDLIARGKVVAMRGECIAVVGSRAASEIYKYARPAKFYSELSV
jgi:hypothetical protein